MQLSAESRNSHTRICSSVETLAIDIALVRYDIGGWSKINVGNTLTNRLEFSFSYE